jgi:hypothetical protein
MVCKVHWLSVEDNEYVGIETVEYSGHSPLSFNLKALKVSETDCAIIIR